MTFRATVAVICGSILTFFAVQIALEQKTALLLRIGVVIAIVAIGVGGIVSLLTPDVEDAPPQERLYTADEVAQLLAAVQSGKLVPVDAAVCKFCGAEQPDTTGVDGTRYHRTCFRAAYTTGKT